MTRIDTKKPAGVAAWRRRLDDAIEVQLGTVRFGAAACLVVDCSDSMAGGKVRQARAGALGFAERALQFDYAVGLIRFASKAMPLTPPQRLFGPLAAAVEKLTASGSTNMAAAIRMGIELLSECHGTRVICVVTDGMPDSAQEALNAAAEAKQQGIDIMAIGTDDADRSFLAKLVTRKDLVRTVSHDRLSSGIAEMSALLPAPHR
ncbi:MAG: vWA domain-containing protein [Defluviicoccus sp.]